MELQILIIEDDKLLRKAMYDRLTKWGHLVQACDSLGEARMHIEKNDYELIFTDMCLPDGDGLDFVVEQKKENPTVELVVMTAFADVRTAVGALKNGAYDYLPKPFEDAQLEKIVRNVGEKRTLSSQVSTLSQLAADNVENLWQFGDMIGTANLGKVFDKARRIAQSPDTTVLILGESGSGKGMLAKAIHRNSPRADKPFVDINCSAIPGQLMESELFGYEKGAFTDAKNRKPGLLEVAQGGTVFLDEIGDMELNLQGKILKVLEDKEFRRLGGAHSTRVDIRVIAATNRDLVQMVKDGKFREDLYYRLTVIPVTMPPLREHRESIEPLAKSYLSLYCKQIGRKLDGFTPGATKAMLAYGWPGNVRELRNVIERVVILATGNKVDVEELGLLGAGASPMKGGKGAESDAEIPLMSLASAEKKLIATALTRLSLFRGKTAYFQRCDLHFALCL